MNLKAMRRSTTLLRVEQLLDLFHDGFHKLFGSPERRFKRELKKAKNQSRLHKKDIAVRKRDQRLALEQDNHLEFKRQLQKRKQLSDQIIKERINSLEQHRSGLTQENDIEL